MSVAIFIVGEAGSGKSLLAKKLHFALTLPSFSNIENKEIGYLEVSDVVQRWVGNLYATPLQNKDLYDLLWYEVQKYKIAIVCGARESFLLEPPKGSFVSSYALHVETGVRRSRFFERELKSKNYGEIAKLWEITEKRSRELELSKTEAGCLHHLQGLESSGRLVEEILAALVKDLASLVLGNIEKGVYI